MNTVIVFRKTVTEEDLATVVEITRSTGFFSEAEIAIAGELVGERLEKGEKSGFLYLFAEQDGKTLGYSCYGPIAGTVSSFDLYWIAVAHDSRGKKLGSAILAESEREIGRLGGVRIYVETSSRALYEPTRAFYEKRGYKKEAVLEDFYAPGDGKVIYVKVLAGKGGGSVS